MNFALLAAQKGHTVEILEKAPELGGKLNPASVPKVKFDIENYTNYLKAQIAKEPGVSVRLGVEVTNELLKAGGYDAVVFSNGTHEGVPPIPGIDTIKYVQATDLLMDPAKLDGAKKVVVVGGGAVGMSPGTPELERELRRNNGVLGEAALFYLQGGLDLAQLKWPVRLVLAAIAKSARKTLEAKNTRTAAEEQTYRM